MVFGELLVHAFIYGYILFFGSNNSLISDSASIFYHKNVVTATMECFKHGSVCKFMK